MPELVGNPLLVQSIEHEKECLVALGIVEVPVDPNFQTGWNEFLIDWNNSGSRVHPCVEGDIAAFHTCQVCQHWTSNRLFRFILGIQILGGKVF